MKASVGAAVMAGALVVMLAGCAGTASKTSSTGTGSTTTSDTSSAAPVEGIDPIPTDGPGESAALAALPKALDKAKTMREGAGQSWPDLKGAEPRLTAYILAVDLAGQTTLLEVRADGIAHSLYAYQRAFDSASLVWTPTDVSGTARSAPRSDGERAAVAAAEAAVRDSFPDDQFATAVYGYRFVYVANETPVLNLEIATDGSVISVSD